MKSLFNEASRYLKKANKIIFGKAFQKRVNEIVKSKKKARTFLQRIH